MTDSKFVKIEIKFKCPAPECGVGETSNGAECLRCVLMHMYRDPKMWEESQKRSEPGIIDMDRTMPAMTQKITNEDLEFLESPTTLIVSQMELDEDLVNKVLDLRRGAPQTYTPILTLKDDKDDK